MQVHTVPFAKAERLAILAFSTTCPIAISEDLEAIVPHVHEIVLVDVSLLVIVSDTQTGGNAAINQDAGCRDTCLTDIEPVAHLRLILAQKALAGIFCMDSSLLTCFHDEIHKTTEINV